jgi:HSP20 family protein
MTTLMEPLVPSLRDVSDGTVRPFIPATDVLVDDEGVTVCMDVPALTVGDIEIELESETLSVRGERRSPYREGDGRAVRRIERGFGRFERRLTLPRGLDADKISASLNDGVLTLRVPRSESLKPRRHAIGVPAAA